VSETSGIVLISFSTSAAICRSVAESCVGLQNVSAQIGTSSIDRGFTSGGGRSRGHESASASSFARTRTSARSGSSPTRKRTTRRAEPGEEVE
jgi:hypothetical protein